MKTPDPWAQMAAILAGEASEAEQTAFAAWLSADPAHQRQFEAMRAAWEAKVPAPEASSPEATLARLHQRLQAAPEEAPAPVIRPRWYKAWGWAAAVLLLCGLAYFWQPNSPAYLTYQTGAGQKMPVQLPDGSRVLLNAHTRLQWTPTDGATRVVNLAGEAFFDVAPDPEKPFVVSAQQTQVRVLGTAFNLRAYPQDSVITAAVQAGKISFAHQQQPDTLTLTASEVATWEAGTTQPLRVPQPLQQSLAWTRDELQFQEQSLSFILEKMERWYGVPIKREAGALEGCRLTADFTHLSLEEVLQLIDRVFPLETEQKGDTLYLRGQGCLREVP